MLVAFSTITVPGWGVYLLIPRVRFRVFVRDHVHVLVAVAGADLKLDVAPYISCRTLLSTTMLAGFRVVGVHRGSSPIG